MHGHELAKMFYSSMAGFDSRRKGAAVGIRSSSHLPAFLNFVKSNKALLNGKRGTAYKSQNYGRLRVKYVAMVQIPVTSPPFFITTHLPAFLQILDQVEDAYI